MTGPLWFYFHCSFQEVKEKARVASVFVPTLDMGSGAFTHVRDMPDALCPWDWPGSGLSGGSLSCCAVGISGEGRGVGDAVRLGVQSVAGLA